MENETPYCNNNKLLFNFKNCFNKLQWTQEQSNTLQWTCLHSGNMSQIVKTIILPEKKIFHSTATKTAKKGWYSGGLIFIVENNLKSSFIFPNDRIGVLNVGANSIIQVYLPFNDGKIDTITEYSNQLDVISKTIQL